MNRTSMVITRIGAASFLVPLAACARPLETLRIDGSAGVAPLVSALVNEYQTRHPAALIVMASGLGSSARLKAVEEGRIDLAMASHGLDSADLVKRGLTARPIARTAVVFAVNTSVPVSALSSKQICDIYAGRIRNWRELGGPDMAVHAVTRPKGEVDADVALEGVACLREITLGTGVQVIERPDEMARVLAATPGAVGSRRHRWWSRAVGACARCCWMAWRRAWRTWRTARIPCRGRQYSCTAHRRLRASSSFSRSCVALRDSASSALTERSRPTDRHSSTP